MIVLRLLSLLGLKSRLRPRTSRFFGEGGGVSLDSWTPGPKPLCHRHPTGPHPSGLLWTPVDSRHGDPTKSDFALALGGIDGRHDAFASLDHLAGVQAEVLAIAHR